MDGRLLLINHAVLPLGYCSDTSFNVFPTLGKPSLRLFEGPQGPHVIGRESDSLKFDELDFLLFSRKF